MDQHKTDWRKISSFGCSSCKEQVVDPIQRLRWSECGGMQYTSVCNPFSSGKARQSWFGAKGFELRHGLG